MDRRGSSGAQPGETDESPYVQTGNRRDYKLWFKRQVVEETFAPGASVSVVARSHNLNSNLVFRWRVEYRQGVLKGTRPERAQTFTPLGIIGQDGMLVQEPPAKTSCIAPPVLPAPQPVAAKVPGRQMITNGSKTEPVPSGVPTAGIIELQLSGRIKVRIEGNVAKDTLRRVLAVAREFG